MTDLHFNSAASVTGWTPIDDRVMGGVSSSQLVFHQDGYAVFAGQVSSDHGGGLASVRHCDLGLGDGNTVGYRLQVRNDSTRLFDARWAFFLGFFDMPKVERATGFAATNLQGALALAICQLIIRVDLRKKMSPRKWNYIIIF